MPRRVGTGWDPLPPRWARWAAAGDAVAGGALALTGRSGAPLAFGAVAAGAILLGGPRRARRVAPPPVSAPVAGVRVSRRWRA